MRKPGQSVRAARSRLLRPFIDQLHKELELALHGPFETLLDVGCGADSPLSHVRHRLSHTVGADAYEPALRESARRHIHDETVLMNGLEILQHFGPRSYDVVLACDVIEHLEKSAGASLIRAMETVARKRVIIMTPNGFLQQGAHDGNPFQIHRSGWTPREMRAHGFSKIVGINGLRPLRGELATVRWHPRAFWNDISLLSQPLVRTRPEWAFQILCIKDVAAGLPTDHGRPTGH